MVEDPLLPFSQQSVVRTATVTPYGVVALGVCAALGGDETATSVAAGRGAAVTAKTAGPIDHGRRRGGRTRHCDGDGDWPRAR